MFGGLLGCGCLLAVVPFSVPVRCGDGEEDSHVDDHRRGGSVFAAAECGSTVDEIVCGLPQGVVMPACSADVGAAGPLERVGRLPQFRTGVHGRGLGERVQDLARCGYLCRRHAVVAVVDDQ